MFPGTYAQSDPDRVAVTLSDSGKSLTYGELNSASIKLARYLRDLGLRPNDHIAVVTKNELEPFIVYWAALRSGLYYTAINHHLQPDEAGYIIDDCGAKVLFASSACEALAIPAARLAPNLIGIVATDGGIGGTTAMSDILAATSDEPLGDQPVGRSMLYSSGTTGRPKGILRPRAEGQVDGGGAQSHPHFVDTYGLDESVVYLSPAPIYHSAPNGFMNSVLVQGGTVVMMPRFDAEQTLAAIEKYQITHTQMVPTMFVRILKLPPAVRARYDHRSLRCVVHAAAPCPPQIKRDMIEMWGPILHEYYAATEGAGITMVDSQEWLAKPGTVGRSRLGVLRICGPDGDLLPTGETGTVYFERDEAPFEYYNEPEKTAESRHPEHSNWTTTGDIGHVDEDGYLFLSDRKAFMIISGGVNIYPQEVENILAVHPAVLDCGVFGVPDPEMGESVLAVVEPVPSAIPGADLEATLIEYLRAQIAHYKVPRRVLFADLPRTPSGKLVKGELKKRYASGIPN